MFPQMYTIIQPCQHGCARVEHVEVNRSQSALTALNGGLSWVPEGKYAQLFVNSQLVMSDTRMEHISNADVVRKAHGDVLIAGLGLGMILTEILPKPGVRSVLVIEKCADVIALVAPYFESPKLAVICADIFEWKPARGQKFNVIYNDIWPDLYVDNLEEMAKLHQRQKYWLERSDPSCWLGSWMQEHLRSEKKRNAWL